MLSGSDASLSLWVASAAAFLVCVFFLRAFWNFLSIPEIPPRPDAPAPDCMVVIPARNEELTIARAVASLPLDSVIVVDDHSKDRTAEAARQAGAGVLTAPDLTGGALGKSSACLAGARLLESRWILFTDADTWFEKGFLNSAVAEAAAQDFAFLSIHLWPSGESFRERLMAPLAAVFTYAGMRPRADPASAFLGHSILLRRDAYEFLGGHAAVLNIFAEDIKLAAIARRHRLKIGVTRAGLLGSVRFREPSESLRRAGYRLILLERSALIMVILGSAAMALWPAAVVWSWLYGSNGLAWAVRLAPLVIALAWYRGPLALLFPIAVYPAAVQLWSGLIAALTGHKIRWKGRLV